MFVEFVVFFLNLEICCAARGSISVSIFVFYVGSPADLDSGCVLMLGLQVRAKPSAGLWVL
jgi:hypothetical protein